MDIRDVQTPTQVNAELGGSYSDVMAAQDVALYGGLCALATFDRCVCVCILGGKRLCQWYTAAGWRVTRLRVVSARWLLRAGSHLTAGKTGQSQREALVYNEFVKLISSAHPLDLEMRLATSGTQV